MVDIEAEKARKFRISDFDLIRLLGTGARSSIWEGRDTSTGKSFAIKRTFKQPEDDNRYLDQAINEYEIASRLEHPTIRKVYSLQRVRKLFSVHETHTVMELCLGKTLEENPPDSRLDMCKILIEVARAVHEMNSKGYVHADMKPDNIVVSKKGQVKIIDLGLSCPMGTVKQRIQGTPSYMAPEQLVCWPLDARTDVYNFGATMYWALTGELPPTVVPHQDNSISAHQKSAIPPHIVKPGIPLHLSYLVTDCIKIEPSGRLGGMDAVATRILVIIRELERDQE
ncbi:MAG TPA: serine/threonine protein kinase [Phycisphaerae bacterium]|nr:serine/threonine protein kinase [Phycisphaerae bacterium]